MVRRAKAWRRCVETPTRGGRETVARGVRAMIVHAYVRRTAVHATVMVVNVRNLRELYNI